MRLISKLFEVGPLFFAVLVLRRLVPTRLLYFARFAVFEIAESTESTRLPSTPIYAHDVERLTALGQTSAELSQRVQRGDPGQVVWEGSTPIAYLWASKVHEYREAGLRFRTSEGYWLYDGFVAREHRCRGMFPDVLGALVNRIGRASYCVETINRPSMQANCKVAQVIGYLNVIRVSGKTRCWPLEGWPFKVEII